MKKELQTLQKATFKNNTIYKPITAEQVEALTNEFLPILNKIAAPTIFDPDFVCAILLNVTHSPEQKKGITTKSSLFDGCIDYISRRLTFEMSEALRAKIEAKNKEKESTDSPPTENQEEMPVEANNH